MDDLDPIDPCRFVDLRPEWEAPLIWPHGHRLHECGPGCPEAIFKHSSRPDSLHRCGPYCSEFQGPLQHLTTPPPNPMVIEYVLGRCLRCRGRIMQRLWGIVTRRNRRVSVQAHNCVRCWAEPHAPYVETIP